MAGKSKKFQKIQFFLLKKNIYIYKFLTNFSRALLLLKKKRYQEKIIDQTLNHLSKIEQMVLKNQKKKKFSSKKINKFPGK